ncbi:MAG: tetratricopeptide repeat protein [Myxococcota bacterium]
MNCPLDESLSALLVGGLPEAEAELIRSHLDVCESCRTTVAALARVGTHSTDEPEAPSEAGVRLPQPSVGGRIDRFVVERVIGAGAMGVVYAAKDAALDRTIALKLLHGARSLSGTLDSAGTDISTEARALARLNHPNVVKVWDLGVWEGRMFIAMELVEGQTLRSFVKSGAPKEAILARVIEAGRGLAAAHDKGIIHRDMKPDNILVSEQGRALVTDFGLATELSARPGSMAGTPAYMAPEQLEGQAATAKSDQFSLAVTLVEALSGRRPYLGSTLAELKEAVGKRPIDEALISALPRAIRAPVLRALAARPEDRWPDVAAFLGALEPRPSSPWRTPILIGAGALLIALAVGGWRARLCTGGTARAQAVWEKTRSSALEQAFVATGAPWAKDAAHALSAELDRFTAAWASSFDEACRATRIRGEQSEQLLDLRVACLDRRLAEADAMIGLFLRADQAVLESASKSLSRLSPLSMCADTAALQASIPPPPEKDRAAVDGLKRSLTEASALFAVGAFSPALSKASSVAADAQALGYRPLVAEALTLKGQLDTQLDAYDRASEDLHRAIAAAEASGHARAAAQAWALLIAVEGDKRAHHEEALRAREHAVAVVEHLGQPRDLAALVARNGGRLLEEDNKLDDAEREIRTALALYRAIDERGAAVGETLNALGNVLRAKGEVKAALEAHEEALALVKARLGPEHPDVALVLKNLGNVYWLQSQLEPALAKYTQALELQRRTLGEDSLAYASTLNNVASVHIRQQKLSEAEAELRQVIRTMERKLGPNHRDLYGQLNNLAVVLRYENRLGDAEAALRRAYEIAVAAVGPEQELVATTLINLGDTLLAQHRFQESAEEYEKAAAITEKLLGPLHPNLADCLGGEAFPRIELKDYRKAKALTERALSIYAQKEGVPMVVAQVHFGHAVAAYALEPSRRAQAIQEAKDARAVLVTAGAQDAELADLDAWLKEHPR